MVRPTETSASAEGVAAAAAAGNKVAAQYLLRFRNQMSNLAQFVGKQITEAAISSWEIQ